MEVNQGIIVKVQCSIFKVGKKKRHNLRASGASGHTLCLFSFFIFPTRTVPPSVRADLLDVSLHDVQGKEP